jgi:hypothetical protein
MENTKEQTQIRPLKTVFVSIRNFNTIGNFIKSVISRQSKTKTQQKLKRNKPPLLCRKQFHYRLMRQRR